MNNGKEDVHLKKHTCTRTNVAYILEKVESMKHTCNKKVRLTWSNTRPYMEGTVHAYDQSMDAYTC